MKDINVIEQYIEDKISDLQHAIELLDLSDINEVMKAHKYASQRVAYVDVLNYIRYEH